MLKIKKNNIKSLKSFKKANYIKIKEYKNHYLFRNTIKHDNLASMKSNNFKKYESIIFRSKRLDRKIIQIRWIFLRLHLKMIQKQLQSDVQNIHG